ncbi:MAG: 3-deoxy-manno-octulosonate cytidylyltransferase [Lentisphaeria bacterium]|nr:3-deoxy-manno-octulosonate cytidylyltransferase [Lentisphaeria bacterium]
MSKVHVVIPARYASSRFPGKVLAPLCGKPMIQHVYDRASLSDADEIFIATDEPKVYDAVTKFGGKCIMTSAEHQSGTDRIYEAINSLQEKPDIVINVQGDEPLIPTSVINELIQVMKDNPDLPMATVAVKLDRAYVNDPNKVKVIFDKNNRAIYFSRAPIPFVREGGIAAPAYLHWGIYAYRFDALKRFVALPPGKLENCEKLEQLRVLEDGMPIYVVVSDLQSVGVDTPEDLEEAERKMKELM